MAKKKKADKPIYQSWAETKMVRVRVTLIKSLKKKQLPGEALSTTIERLIGESNEVKKTNQQTKLTRRNLPGSRQRSVS